MKTLLLMDIVIAFFGIYLGVIAIRMKKTGKINSVVVAEDEIKKCKDPKAYIKSSFPYMIFFAIVSFVVGVVGILADRKIIQVGRVWTYVELVAFLIALAIFAHGMRENRSKYIL